MTRKALGYLGMLCLSACVVAPVTSNLASDAVPRPDVNGTVTLALKAPVGARTALFRVRGAPAGFSEPFDDSPDDDFIVQIDTRTLATGLYVVDVFMDDSEEAAASLVFVKPEARPESSEARGT